MIVNVPTFYMVYLDQHFAEVSRGMITDEDIYESLKNVEYVEKLSVKRQYKYKTVRAKIRLTKSYETIYKEGGSYIAITINERTYFFRMFDVKLS